MTPKRIQRKRTAGWRMPEGAVYVGRPTKWGNPFRGGEAVLMFRAALYYWPSGLKGDLGDPAVLRGKDLACWCPLDRECHADVLLEWANEATP